ncbi:general secretion pathway protein GspK [Bradyrhizobium lablabi]|nr:general secretion pathway protein GspK [Bradyrhizobium lablabi]
MGFRITPGDERNSRGFIVVAVLWILAALSALVLIYLNYVTSTAVVVATGADRVQTEALVTAGVELAAFQLSGVSETVRPTSGTFDARVGAGKVVVTFRSEAARVDLNAAPKGLLAGLIAGLGASPENAAYYAERILAWRSPASGGENDPENSFYRTSGAPYLPRHAPFPLAEELWLVHGVPPLVIEKILPFVTVFSNLSSINVADAAPQVLAALPGMTPEKLQALLAQRSDPSADPNALLAMAGSEGASLAGSRAYRINVAVAFGGVSPNAAEVVILLLDGGEAPYRVLSWRNMLDGATAPQRAR